MKWQHIKSMESIQSLPQKIHLLGELYHLKYVFGALPFSIDFSVNFTAELPDPPYQMQNHISNSGSNSASNSGSGLSIYLPEKWLDLNLNHKELQLKFESAFENWREQQIREFTMARAPFWLEKMQTHVSAWQFKKLKATWGLCRLPSRVICLNTRLFHFSPLCIEAVLVHELSHLFHPNHSPRFYQHLLHYFPEYKKAKQMLRQNLLTVA